MKKIITMTLVLLLALSVLVACGDEDPVTPEDTTAASETVGTPAAAESESESDTQAPDNGTNNGEGGGDNGGNGGNGENNDDTPTPSEEDEYSGGGVKLPEVDL